MRKISANYLFPVTAPPIRNGVVVLSDENEILEIFQKEQNKETANVEFHNGVLVPGFINAHCHLELSHLQNKISKNNGLIHFINQVRNVRDSHYDISKTAMDADMRMQSEGIVAVGDISNSTDTFQLKQNSNIQYYTFIELFSPIADKAEDKLKSGNELLNELHEMGLRGSLTPHSFYSASELLLDKIKNEAFIYSVHFLESPDEQRLLENRDGDFADFFNQLNLHVNDLIKIKNTFEYAVVEKLPLTKNILLVHNTYINENQIRNISQQIQEHLYWTICPNSNLNIENTIPNLSLFLKNNQKVTIGTDSLASNSSLSILEEMKTVSVHYPEISFNEILTWATINGANALEMANKLGSLEPGKKPGINLIDNFDFEHMTLTKNSKVRVMAR
jgi:cytosine/adenosine deaminase-related metal-dependent hydrolase